MLRLAAYLLLPLLMLFPAAARAYSVGIESIEWMVADSDGVVAGKVLSVDTVKGADKADYEKVTVAVSNVLKGKVRKRVTFVIQHAEKESPDDPLPRNIARNWRTDAKPRLFFLLRNDGKRADVRVAGEDWALRARGGQHSAIVLDQPLPPRAAWVDLIDRLVCTRDYHVLNDPKAILAYVRSVVKEQGDKPPTELFGAWSPRNTEIDGQSPGDGVMVIVPIDAALEADARKWSHSADGMQRQQAAEALGYFKNAENIAILKSLLVDGDVGEEWGDKHRKMIFPVRQAAYEALTAMHITVTKPLLEVDLPNRSAATQPADGR